ncbi:hypothetical protein IR148_03955 [Dysgonomonas mossii]|uniref:Uncharacterized protein n=1 Tax=Dysgonomonas mossii TaxID=163665 RepID=A0A4Y9IU21_9BACT|nr:hypothetical protein [Dysgonomonas mossii]MBF0760196.1 hypothetical protein [Dysgonomonas mossii]TFU91145.1 hypothetical protein E4T88_03950 [Dysgonomonas mossii]
MKKFIFILNIIVVVGFLLWFINEPGWEPAIGFIAAIVGLISQFIFNDEIRRTVIQIKEMSQKAGNKSTQYQSAGNMTISSNTSSSLETGNGSRNANTSANIDKMSQEAGDNSTQYQSGGDMTIINDK